MKKIIAIFAVILTVFSCSKTSDTIFDGQRRMVNFDRSSATLEVIIDDNEDLVSNDVTVNVVSTETSSEDRTYDIELVSSTIDASSVEFPTTVTIPASVDGEENYTGSFTVTGFNVDELTTSNELFVFEIVGSSDNSDINGDLKQVEMQMRLVCQLDSASFVGDYLITQVPETDEPAFGGVVTLELVEGRSTSRQFEAVYLEYLGIGQPPTNIVFDISCGTIVPDDDMGTSLLCDGDADPITFGGPIGDRAVIDPSDDSEFTIIMQEGQSDGGCDGYPFDVEFVLTKQ